MLWSNVLLTPASSLYAYKWEIVGFRAAWVSVTQLPLIYCLSCKINVISLITGISYERLNWLHRWVARTLFLTVIVHWSFFFQEWTIAEFVDFELQMMPMVKYGFGAWGVIGWMVLSSFGLFRRAGYEFFVFQHLASAGILLWLLHIHVPSYAAYNIWLAIGFVAFDRVSRLVWITGRNLHLFARAKNIFVRGKFHLGYMARISPLPAGYVGVAIDDIDFSWKPGQHIYISIPSIGFVEFHPFTIANEPKNISNGGTRSINLYIKAHSGFTGRLQRKAQRSTAEKPLRVFISGPWGLPPSVEAFETVILIGTSSGASFTVPIFQSLARKPFCVRRIYFHWIIRDPQQVTWFSEAIQSAISEACSQGVEVLVSLHITGSIEPDASRIDAPDTAPLAAGGGKKCMCCKRDSDSSTHIMVGPSKTDEEKQTLQEEVTSPDRSDTTSATSTSTERCLCSHTEVTVTAAGRPTFDSLIRKPVEGAHGETAILGCGGRGFSADLRSYVTRLSDERAVHKGTGAQGLFLFTETFGW
ncbi:hypothetical protein MMC30_009082 [Trapelia coarctata]|nr:hypothetical protein [Trapelia coarctata]